MGNEGSCWWVCRVRAGGWVCVSRRMWGCDVFLFLCPRRNIDKREGGVNGMCVRKRAMVGW